MEPWGRSRSWGGAPEKGRRGWDPKVGGPSGGGVETGRPQTWAPGGHDEAPPFRAAWVLLVFPVPPVAEVGLCRARTLGILGSSAALAAPGTRRGLVGAGAEASGEESRLDRWNWGPAPDRDPETLEAKGRAARPGSWLQAQASGRISFLP